LIAETEINVLSNKFVIEIENESKINDLSTTPIIELEIEN
jgi:hypothetical protein